MIMKEAVRKNEAAEKVTFIFFEHSFGENTKMVTALKAHREKRLIIDIVDKNHQCERKIKERKINVISILSSQMKSLKKIYLLMN